MACDRQDPCFGYWKVSRHFGGIKGRQGGVVRKNIARYQLRKSQKKGV